MRDAVRDVFPQLEEVDDPPTRRFRIPAGLDGLYQAPTAEELAALAAAAEVFAQQGAVARAGALKSLEQKVLSATRAAARRKLAPDLEALLQAETIAVQAGPRPFEDEAVLATVREALLSMRSLRFRYEGGSAPGRVREVTPFGVLFGRSNYLVADEGQGPRNWRLDRIGNIAIGERPTARPEGFSLQAYADESFGIYQDDTADVVLRVTPAGAEDALRWRFHANQSVEPQADGAVVVRFRASGMLELAWHLFTWGDKVQVLAPESLRTILIEQIDIARRAHASGPVVAGS
jgi:predicted DNA-binding transcriptional regulator YafY